MSLWLVLMGIAAIAATQALALAWVNLRRYRRAGPGGPEPSASLVSVCIPARNEEANIEACVRSLLVSRDAAIEVLCYDDQSTDRTAEILARLKAEDSRVRTPPTVPLPDGWNGKQHGCQRMAEHARGRWYLFTDADVRFTPDAIARTVAEAERRDVGLLSTVPKQDIGSVGEALVVPLIHFLLLSYLPMGRMRRSLDPAASAGCGQFLFARADAYRASGGHAAFRASMHDGIRMPRAFRAAGWRTDLFDGTDLVRCRMYRGFAQTWRGFAKNAYEGLGSVTLLVFLTAWHGIGHVLPWAFLAWSLVVGRPADAATGLAALAIAAGVANRLLLARRFEQPWSSVVLHPLGIVAMTLIQWHSLLLAKTGRRAWKGRVAGTDGGPSPEPIA